MDRHVLRFIVVCSMLVMAGAVHAQEWTVRTSLGYVVKSAPLLLSMAKTYEAKKNYPTAIFLYDQILAQHPSDKKVLNMMIRCYDKMLQEELREARASIRPPVEGPSLPPLPNDGVQSDSLNISARLF